MMRITVDQMMAKCPCNEDGDGYSLERVKALWAGVSLTLLEILDLDIPPEDRIWAVTRFLSDRDNRLFACDCAETVVHLTTDPRVASAIAVARRFADGEATGEELRIAYAAAGAAGAGAAGAAGYAAGAGGAAAGAAAAGAAAGAAAAYAAGAAAGYAAYAAGAARSTQVDLLRARLTAPEDPTECQECYGSGGGTDPETMCLSCGGSGSTGVHHGN